ncbi:DNA polymerase I [Patescibacteria group bacterium]|nr:DNA polymerase I [Patescibacteria group bacterium]MBU1907310.1 DNA polymerase I [Patescibacteria group bacterium]
MPSKKKLCLILDGNALLHRAWHALPPLTTKDGRVVNAAYGFTMVLEKMLEERQPDYMVVAWDLPGKTFRHAKYAEYKATREVKEQELYDQIPMIQEILDAFGIPSLSAEGYEADDVIGTLAKRMDKKPEVAVEIVTGDLDALQLVTDGTKVLFFQKGISETKLYDKKAVRERYGLNPDQVIDFKALKGDASDNIPGVPGVGDKTATEVIGKFGTLEQVYKDLKAGKTRDLKDRVVQKLLDNKKEAFDSKELVTIVTDVPLDYKLSDLKISQPNEEAITKLYQDFEFRTLLRKRGQQELDKKIKKPENKKISSGSDLSTLEGAKELALFAASNPQADLFGSDLAVLALSDGKQTVVLKNPSADELQDALDLIAATKLLVVHDLKKLLHELGGLSRVARRTSIKNDERFAISDGQFFDLMVASYLAHSGSRSHDIAAIAHEHLKTRLPETPTAYAAERDYQAAGSVAAAMLELKTIMETELKKDGMLKLFQQVEMPLVPILFNMEQTGIKIDVAFLNVFSKDLAKRIDALTKKIYQAAGTEFNIKSPQQLAEVLFEKLELPTKGIKRTKTGYSTAAPELEKLRDAHPLIAMIEEYRELAKLASTYVDALPKLVAKDGRVHTSFNQTVTATGRLSSSDPNLQNIPIRTELGREIRKAFVADKGKVLIAADYSQIELRLVSVIAKDKAFQKAFKEGADIHRRTAAEVLGIDEEKVTKDQRRSAKAINFGIIYGMGARALAASTGLSFTEAQEFIQRYLDLHHSVRDYLEETKLSAHENEYVETMFGRRRYLPEISSGMQMLVAAAERMAINMPVQGAAADIMKMAMIEVAKWIETQDGIEMLLQVHDELVFEVDKEKAEEYAGRIKEIMENVVKLDVPLVVDVEIGQNWGAMKQI